MVTIASTFSVMATKYSKVNGVIDYAEATCGKTYAYYVGWFISLIYYPAMTSVLAWVSARYTMVAIFGVSSSSPQALYSAECITIAAFYLVLVYFINTIAPKIAGKIQVSTTIIKLVPLAFIAIVGTAIGLVNGTLTTNFTHVAEAVTPKNGGLFAAICCTAFAYEGWIIATSINAEIKDSKKNLPRALFIGSIIVVATYVLYYVGILGLTDSSVLITQGTSEAFKFFGSAGTVIINFLIIISCLGTLNGLMLGCCRGPFSLSVRGQGLKPQVFSQIDEQTNMPHNSSIFGILLCAFWFIYFLGSQFFGWWGVFAFDSSELPIITIYPLYIPILISFMIREKDLHPFKRFVLPILSLCGVGIMVAASIFRHGLENVFYLIVFAVIMFIGFLVQLYNKKKGVPQQDQPQEDNPNELNAE